MKGVSTFVKLLACIMAGISCIFCLMRVGHRFLAEWLPMPVLWLIAACLFLIALGNGVYWAFAKRSGQADAQQLAFWQGVVRYTIAIDLIMIGMQGFFGLIFFVRLGVLDLPFSSLSGEELTWAYFGHYSTGFLYFICCIQILGGMLLLFSRTRLLGVFVLIPVMVVIVTLNHFYDMELAETATAIELLIQLLYLLLSERQRLWVFFVKERPSVPATSLRPFLKNLLRVSAFLIPLLLLWRYDALHPKPVLTGKYAVSHWVVNGHERVVQPCADNVLTCVYLDLGNDCVFEFNSTSRRWIGEYVLSDSNKKMNVVWHYPANVHDTLAGEIRQDEVGGGLRIDGFLGKDSIQISLVKDLSRH